MEAVILFHMVGRWCLLLAESAFAVWLAALLIALLGWSAWGLSRIATRVWRAAMETRRPAKSVPRHADR